MARYPQAILVSCEIPWDENEQLLEDVFRREIRMVLQNFNHLYIFGTAGEGYAVDTARFQQIVSIFQLQKEFHDMIMDVLSARLREGRIDGAYDKMLVRLGGLEEMPLRLLSPYQSFSEEEYLECKRILHEKYPDWLAANAAALSEKPIS